MKKKKKVLPAGYLESLCSEECKTHTMAFGIKHKTHLQEENMQYIINSDFKKW